MSPETTTPYADSGRYYSLLSTVLLRLLETYRFKLADSVSNNDLDYAELPASVSNNDIETSELAASVSNYDTENCPNSSLGF